MRTPASVIICLLFAASAFGYGEPNGTFPSWEERAMAQLSNRARVNPATDLAGCPAGQCLEAACYAAKTPLIWNYDLNQSSRFHSTSMGKFPFWGHDTPCVLFTDIDSRFPGTSDGSFASSCSSSGTTIAQSRVSMFGVGFAGENIMGGYSTPHDAFYYWLYETASTSACGFTQANGHRYNILTNGPALGAGYAHVAGSPWGDYWTEDFGGSGTIPKIPSGSHWTSVNHLRDATPGDNSVEFWANWYNAAGGPNSASVVLDGTPATMTRTRGTATNGAWSVTIAGVSASCHTYYFSFVDATNTTVRYPTTGALGFGSGCPDFQGASSLTAPTGVNAIATSGTQVQVTWNAVTGASSYEIYRRDPGSSSFLLRGTSSTLSYGDAASAGAAYLYRVRAVNASGSSADSAVDLATTVMFTNDPLQPGLFVRSVHLNELRTAVSAVRAQAKLAAVTYTDPSPGALKAVYISELRTFLDQAMTALQLTTGGWTDSSLTGLMVNDTHFQEIRNRVK